MRILLITTRFAPHVGGVENVVENLAKEFSKNNDVCVVTSLMCQQKSDAFVVSKPIDKRHLYAIKRIWLNLPRSFFGLLVFPYRLLFGVFRLVSFIRAYRPDVMNLHFPDDSSIYVWIAMRFLNIPLIVNIHGNDLHIFSKNPIYRFFIARLLRDAKKCVVNSRYMQEGVLNEFPFIKSKMVIIHNGLDIDSIKKIPVKNYTSKRYIFFVGRFVHKKGCDILIKAFKKADIPDLFMIMEGIGEEMASIKSLIKDLGMENKIILTEGKLSSEEKFAYMKGAMFGVMPSRIEPFGIVALEFMAAGVPLVASRTGGLKDILSDKKNALLFKNGDVNELAEKIKLLYMDKKLRNELAVKASKKVKEYKWSEVSYNYLVLYKGVLHA